MTTGFVEKDVRKTYLSELDNIIKSVPGYVYWFDRNNCLLGCNTFFYDNMEISLQEDNGGFLVSKFLEKNSAEGVVYNNNKVLSEKKEFIFEEDIVLKSSGLKSVFLSNKSPLFNSSNEIIGVICLSQDITQYKEVQNFLLKKQLLSYPIDVVSDYDRFSSDGFLDLAIKSAGLNSDYAPDVKKYVRDIFSTFSDHIYWLDCEGKYIDCNVSAAKALQLMSSHEIEGKTPYDFYKTSDADRIHESNMYVVASKASLILQELMVIDGQDRWFSVKKTPILNKEGEVSSIFLLSSDITEIKTLQNDFSLAKGKADEADISKRDFLMNISHDFRTPCSGILGFAKALQEEETDLSKADKIDCIVRSANRLLDLLNNIIEYSKFDANGLLKIKKDKFSLFDLIQSFSDLLSTEISNKSLSFSVDYFKTMPREFVGDRTRIHRILLNIITNAVKFTDKGGVEVEVSLVDDVCALSFSGMVVVQVLVRDTGIGIDEDHMDLIFEPFYRASLSCHGKYEGMGLGLGLVKKMINEINGRILVESQLNKGSTFICQFPLLSIEHGKINASSRKRYYFDGDEVSEDDFSKRRERVLVVEDDKISQFLARSLLKDTVESFDIVSCAKEALDKNIEDYDLVLLDIGLPDQDGFQVASSMRDTEKKKNLKPVIIVALTAHLDPVHMKKCESVGIDLFKNKPLTTDVLQEILNFKKDKVAGV